MDEKMRSALQPFLQIIFYSIFVLFFFCHAEAAPFKRPLSFQQITPKEGLSSEMVYSVAIQGEEVWFGT